jgi:hypothetical protein
MPLFTFYPCRKDGSSTAFETFEQYSDDDALERAGQVLREHASAVEVVIWQGERRVGAVQRLGADA